MTGNKPEKLLRLVGCMNACQCYVIPAFFFYSHYCRCHQFERKKTRKLAKRYWICWVSQQLRNAHWQKDFGHKVVRTNSWWHTINCKVNRTDTGMQLSHTSVGRHRSFTWTYCLHLQGNISEMLVPTTTLHDVTERPMIRSSACQCTLWNLDWSSLSC